MNNGGVQPPKRTKTGTPTAQPPVPEGHNAMAPIQQPPPTSLVDLEPESVPANYKRHGEDWYAVFNKNVPRVLDVSILHTFEHPSVVCCVRFSTDGKYIATGCNKSAQIFDVKTGQKVVALIDESIERDGDLYIRSVSFSPDGKYLATGAEDKIIRIWEIRARKIKNQFIGHEQDIYSLDFSRDGTRLASGSGDRTARLWDMESGQCLLTLSIEDGVTTVAISPDGKFLAAGSLDRAVRVWDTVKGALVERLEGHKDSVYSVAFSPTGLELLSGSLDKTVKLWELNAPRMSQLPSAPRAGTCKATFVGHKDFVLSVALSPDGKWVVSGSKDRGVQFWNPADGQPQFMLQGHKNSGTPLCDKADLVISVALSPLSAGKLFATGSGDCRARIWSYELKQ
jgi:general transcriptional corepressor TUP1